MASLLGEVRRTAQASPLTKIDVMEAFMNKA